MEFFNPQASAQIRGKFLPLLFQDLSKSVLSVVRFCLLPLLKIMRTDSKAVIVSSSKSSPFLRFSPTLPRLLFLLCQPLSICEIRLISVISGQVLVSAFVEDQAD